MILVIIFLILFAFWAVGQAANIDKKADGKKHQSFEEQEALRILKAREANKTKPIRREFKVVGVTHYTDALMSFAEENEDYGMSKRDRFENMDTCDDKEWQYIFPQQPAALIPEPDNPHDHNAIRVEFSGVPVGYIARGDCAEVKALLDSGTCTATGFIGGGAYREMVLSDDFDGDRDERASDYTLEEGEINLYARVTIIQQPSSQTCPGCGITIQQPSKFCPNCGHQL